MVWKLTIEDDEGKKTFLPLGRDEYTVGRDEGNTVRLTDRNVSRRHATLKKNVDAGWRIIDLDSYNGCFVNGQRVAGEAKLTNQDLIQLGDYRIFIVDEVEATDGGAKSGPTTIPPAALRPDRLIVLAGPQPGLEFPLDEGSQSIELGRAEECKISINHPSVSRIHAKIVPVQVGGRYEIIDNGSANGVRVNGIDRKRAILDSGDLIELGDVKLRFLEKGHHLRPGADMSQQIDAFSDRNSPSVRPSAMGDVPFKSGMSTVTKVMVVGAILAAGGLAFVALRNKGPEADANAANPTPSASASDDDSSSNGQAALDLAKKAASSGDYDTVFKRLSEIPPGSPLKSTPEVQALYGRWADWQIKQSDTVTDPAQKKAMLQKVAENSDVDQQHRNLATDLIAMLSQDPSGKGTKPTSTKPANTGTSAPKDDGGGNNGSTGSTAPTPPSNGDVTTQQGQDAQRKALESKMNSGRASQSDLKMLKALCQQAGDKACVSRARDQLNK